MGGGGVEGLGDGLGDLLLQVGFHGRMAEEAGAFDFGDVVHAITAKLWRRHPHVFADTGALPVAAVNELWDRIKGEEKNARAERRKGAGADRAETLAGVSTGLFFFSSRRRHTRFKCDWSSDVCSSD